MALRENAEIYTWDFYVQNHLRLLTVAQIGCIQYVPIPYMHSMERLKPYPGCEGIMYQALFSNLVSWPDCVQLFRLKSPNLFTNKQSDISRSFGSFYLLWKHCELRGPQCNKTTIKLLIMLSPKGIQQILHDAPKRRFMLMFKWIFRVLDIVWISRGKGNEWYTAKPFYINVQMDIQSARYCLNLERKR